MTDKELMQRALDALENLQGLCTDSGDGCVEEVTIWTPEIITALRERLAQKEQKHEAWCASLTQLLLINPPKPAPCDCKTKITEPEQVADAMLKEKNK